VARCTLVAALFPEQQQHSAAYGSQASRQVDRHSA